MKTSISFHKAISFVSILAVTSVLLIGLVGIQKAKAAPATIGLQSHGKINKLVYPTFGNPVIKKKGETFTIEFDPREGARWGASFPSCTNFGVSVTSSNDPYPITKSLKVLSVTPGYSTQWPGESVYVEKPTPDNRIYLVTVEVPMMIPEDLYDLSVFCTMGGNPVTDTQIHAFKAVEEYKEPFTFIQMSDIHVFGPECNYPSSNHKKRNNRHTNYVEIGFNGYGDGYGAQYLREAIIQINKIKPDFVINTGDNDFGQYCWSQNNAERGYGNFGEMTEYEFEQLWFYNEMTKLDVPCFQVIGNHDAYKESMANGAKTNDDWQYYWKELYGPLYHSFDYGDNHFTCLNTMDWSPTQRTMTFYDFSPLPLQIMQPQKYKGQVGNRGDDWLAGHSLARFSAENPSVYISQLEWLKNDLAAHQNSKIRVAAMHHDPMKNANPSESGCMWSSSEESGSGGTIDEIMRLFGLIMDMGNGDGRIATMGLLRDYNVALSITGHDHSDFYSTYPWTNGNGEIRFVNTTSTSFQSDSDSGVYPGYQKFVINNGQVSFGYLNNLSYPYYENTNVGGSTNLGNLQDPAIQNTWTYIPDKANATSATCRLTNTLTLKDLPNAYMEFPMKYLNNKHWYQVTNGTFGEIYDNKETSPDHRICQVYSDIGTNTFRDITVAQSAEADNTKPVGTVKINNGATETTSRNVTLKLNLTDTPSGLKDIKVSNKSDFSGAEWEKNTTTKSWKLTAGDGKKTVYIKARDMAMPPNEKTFTATITFGSDPDPNPDPVPNPELWYLAEGTSDYGFDTYITIENPNNSEVNAKVTYMTKDGEVTRPDITLSPMSQTVINPRNDMEAPTDFSTKVESKNDKPIYVDRRMIWTGPGAPSQDGHSSIGVTYTAKTWYLAEGSSKWGFESWLLIQNPNDKDASCDVTYMIEGEEPQTIKHEVKAKSRNTFSMADDIGEKDASIKVVSDIPVIPERAMYRNNRREGHCSIGATNPSENYYLAEGSTDWGFTTYLLVQNPNDTDTDVNVTYMTKAGPVNYPMFSMPRDSRQTIRINDFLPNDDMSISVHGSKPIIAERAMYWGEGTPLGEACHDSIGLASPHTSFYLPDGETYGDMETWVLVQNPNNSEISVEISYLTSNGTDNITFPDTIPANSRKTYSMADSLPDNRASIIVRCTTAGKKIMAERAMYWNSRGAGTGTIGGYSD